MNVTVVDGDLLDQDVDVIVNAWNRNIILWWLLIPQWVSGAIKKRRGLQPFREPESDYVLAWFQILCQLVRAAQDGQFAIVEEACRVVEPFPSGIIANSKELQEQIDKLIVEVFGCVVERELPDSVALYDQADASLSLLMCTFRHESTEVFCNCMDRVSKLANQTYRCALLLQIAHIMCENLTIVRSLIKHSSSKIDDALNDHFSPSVIRQLNCGKHPQTRLGWLEGRVSELMLGFPWDKYPFADA